MDRLTLEAAVREMLREPRMEVLSGFYEAAGEWPATEVARVDLDVLTAFALLDPEDPANPWNAAAKHDELELSEAAASWFIEAARAIRRDQQAEDGVVTWDDPNWADSALYNAARALVSAGLVLSASVLASRIEGKDRDEVIRWIWEVLGQRATTSDPDE